MIVRARHAIAWLLSLLVLVVSLGRVRVNPTGAPTASSDDDDRAGVTSLVRPGQSDTSTPRRDPVDRIARCG